MRFRFGEFELDLRQRELRRSGQPAALTPQVFAFISHLVQHRERVVTKRELCETLWPDVVVSEGSLQRVASLARAALGTEGRELIRTFSGYGYRWMAEVTELPATDAARSGRAVRPRYARSGDVHIAYCTEGTGDAEIVLILGWAFPMQALFELAQAQSLLGQLARLGRVVVFDKRGTGLSDRVKELPSLAQRVDDLRAVLDEVGSQRALLLGVSEGGPLSIAFAESHPERVLGLVLVGAFPRMAKAPDYAHGWTHSEVARLRGYVKNHWGRGATVLALLPEAARARAKAWASSAETAGASPGAALDLLEMNLSIDVRDRLARVQVPSVVLHARDDRVTALEQGRFLAEHIPGARLVEVAGDDHAFLFDGQARLIDEVRGLIGRAR